ncbi:(2,3-dihydroxybenzoyl)adenylate synthase [Nonomuraea sp. NN258]|uniref:(2,3-dihydroxybenzoyl)adenylate synthase n=1 Tax=Nonomuraea antri TaxID=2730852 RepID=UPI00156818F0|nr:(2,3-dihydroxybenzoyl)adenylate synthase [Nonomuraea antri]NRQ38620.1 (2,3-dihydroxybenzoyl)adenylate synthase [Nonomuraea antri]
MHDTDTLGFVPWPPEAAARYRRAGYWRGRPLGDYLHEWADRYGDREALTDGEVRLSYRELADRADGCAARLMNAGLATGDRLLVQLPNCWEYVVLVLACLRLGAAPVLALPAHRGHELRYLARLAEVRAVAVPDVLAGFDHRALGHEVLAATAGARLLLVAGPATAPGEQDLRRLGRPLAGARAELDALPVTGSDVAVLLLSGGTTGLPKLIARTHDDYEYNARASAELCGLGQDTVYLAALPASHNFPLACPGILGTFMNGGRVVLSRSPDPDRVLPLMSAEGVTVTAVVPAVAQRWVDAVASGRHPAPPGLRLLQVGGARLAPEIAGRIGPVLGCGLQQVFGMAEGLLNYTRLDDPDEVLLETQGRPLSPGDEIRIVGQDGEPVPPGEMGALLTRGPYTPRGYFRAAEHNERAFTPDGWYRTGDVVRLHPSGNLMVAGRDKDMINRGGEKISAEEVESLLYRVPGVSRVAAVGVPDDVLGERVCAVVVPEPEREITLAGVRAALAGMEVARFKLPERLLLVEDLPHTKIGKVDKAALRSLAVTHT